MTMTIKRFLELNDDERAAFIKEQSIPYQQEFIQSRKNFSELENEKREAIIDDFCRRAPYYIFRERLSKLGMKEE